MAVLRFPGARSDDRDRLREAVDRNSGDLLAYFARRANPVEDAADMVGETLLTVWRRIRDLPVKDTEVRMWMFGIARNVLANSLRGTRRQYALAQRLRLELLASDATSTRPAPDEDVELRIAVAQLPPAQHEIVSLVHWDGFALVDAAKIIGIPAATARGRYAAARAALRSTLTVHEPAGDLFR
ncbi:MAG: sigma-70 family polymerase sigma factor [Glaciihabitans sp.]|nr:sigma-70 family polymerase sigma factor [Glaciihabitans sp.]